MSAHLFLHVSIFTFGNLLEKVAVPYKTIIAHKLCRASAGALTVCVLFSGHALADGNCLKCNIRKCLQYQDFTGTWNIPFVIFLRDCFLCEFLQLIILLYLIDPSFWKLLNVYRVMHRVMLFATQSY